MKIKDQEFIKRENLVLVINLILKHGAISRSEIARKTDMSFTSASRIVASLLESGLIEKAGYTSEGSGRRASLLKPKKNAVISIGVEIDKNKLRIGFMNFVGELILIEEFQFNVSDPEQTVKFIVRCISYMTEDNNIPHKQIAGICVGLPGLINLEKGEVLLSVQFDWREIPLKRMLEKEMAVPVQIENELKLKAFAENEITFEKPKKDMVLIGFGTGVGSVLISDGEIYRGKDNFAGEIGHTIVDPYGRYCPCGNFGCLQTYIAEQFLIEEASKIKPVESVDEIVREMEKGERWASKIIDKAIAYAVITINNIVSIHNPDIVVISGDLVETHDLIRERIIAKYAEELKYSNRRFHLHVSEIGSNGVVVGAAIKVQQHFIGHTLFQ